MGLRRLRRRARWRRALYDQVAPATLVGVLRCDLRACCLLCPRLVCLHPLYTISAAVARLARIPHPHLLGAASAAVAAHKWWKRWRRRRARFRRRRWRRRRRRHRMEVCFVYRPAAVIPASGAVVAIVCRRIVLLEAERVVVCPRAGTLAGNLVHKVMRVRELGSAPARRALPIDDRGHDFVVIADVHVRRSIFGARRKEAGRHARVRMGGGTVLCEMGG